MPGRQTCRQTDVRASLENFSKNCVKEIKSTMYLRPQKNSDQNVPNEYISIPEKVENYPLRARFQGQNFTVNIAHLSKPSTRITNIWLF